MRKRERDEERKHYKHTNLDVVVAGLDLVRLATLTGVVLASTDDALALPVLPGPRGVSSVTAVATLALAAGHEVLGREVEVLGAVALDAGTVGHGFHCPEGPAGSTAALVPHFLQAGTLKVGRCIDNFSENGVLFRS